LTDSDAMRQGAERPALQDLAHTMRGTAQLLDSVAHASTTPQNLRLALGVLGTLLHRTADQATSLIDDLGIDLTQQLGVSTSDLAAMQFQPVMPAFQRTPPTLAAWTARSEAEFTLWGSVEQILGEDDASLEDRFNASPDEHLRLVDAIDSVHQRWQAEVKSLEATLLRLAVVVARWEQAGT
jgi:hypothetical protein